MAEAVSQKVTVFEMQGEDFFTTCNLQPERVLANGMCGEIVLAIPLEKTHKKRVVKTFVLWDEQKSARNQRMFLTEVRLMMSLNHPFLMRCKYAGICTDYMAICMHHYQRGTLSRYVGGLSYQLSELCATQVACALRYLNKNNIVHLDVKLNNIFYDSNCNAILGDFGLAKEMSPQQKVLTKGQCGGTPCYFAPERIGVPGNTELDPYKLDSFCLGVVLWCLVAEKKPAINFDYYLDATTRQDLPQSVRNWLLKLLDRDPSIRLTATEMLDSVKLESPYEYVINNF